MKETEIWLPIPNLEGLYEVSNLGRIKSLNRKVNNKAGYVNEKILSLRIRRQGYVEVNVQKLKVKKHFFVHRLVALAFIPNPENKLFVNHKNGIKSDNRVENLEWCTAGENQKHAYVHGLRHPNKVLKGSVNHPSCKFSPEDIKNIRNKFNNKEFNKSQLAKIYGTHRPTILKILSNKTYKDA